MNKEMGNKTHEIILYLMELIISRKIPTNKIMPSEHALMYRFNCSRSVVVSAYKRLESLGAIYSIAKRGHFVAENFHNLIKPISSVIKADSQKGKFTNSTDIQWLKEKNIIFPDGLTSFEKEYILNEKIIAYSDQFVSNKYFNEEFDLNASTINQLIIHRGINNIVYHLKYEEVNLFGCNKLVVIYMFGYDSDSISIAARYIIDPDHFSFNHQEFSLT